MTLLPESPGSTACGVAYREQAVVIDCEGDALVGILSLPGRPASRAVLVVVGGPQYRAGSHRQFVLLARALAGHGIAVLRFDYRGMGDSAGAPRDFERVSTDLGAAVNWLFAAVPALRDVVLWGLCDGASAAVDYAGHDARVAGIALLNPWIRTPDGIARATIRHYYRARLLDGHLWRKILAGHFDYRAAARSLVHLLGASIVSGLRKKQDVATLPERLLAGLARFPGRVLVILSGQDLTANEFSDLACSSRAWKRALGSRRTQWHRLEPADHTFSCRAWRDQVALWTRDWVQSW